MAQKTETPARKNVQLNTSVSPEVADALQEYRFQNRIEKRGDVLALAVTRFLESENIVVAAPADAGE